MKNLEDSISGFDEKFIKKELQKIGVNWIDLNLNEYSSIDGSHLHYMSAERLSQKIGIVIKNLNRKGL